MSDQNDRSTTFLLAVIAICAGLIGLVFVLFTFWPYIVFYLIPFLVGSALVGFVLKIACIPDEKEWINYKNLAVVYPILILFTGLVFFSSGERALQVDKKGNVTARYLDWPKVNRAFNNLRARTYLNSPFESLQQQAKESVIYDRHDVGWIFICCLILGGPLCFWYWTLSDEKANRESVDKMAEERTIHERERINAKERDLNKIIHDQLKLLREEVAHYQRQNKKLHEANQSLMAKVEFSAEVPKPTETEKANGGLLDKDIL